MAIEGDLRLAVCFFFFFVKVNTFNTTEECIYFIFPQGICAWQRGPRADAGSQSQEACGSSAVSVALLYFTLLSFASQDRGRDI